MTKYIAQFSNGDIVTRNSEREYSHAYRLTAQNGDIYQQGFSARRELAEKAAHAAGPRGFNARARKYAHIAQYHRKMAKEKGFASVNEMYAAKEAEIAQWWADAKIEIVEV